MDFTKLQNELNQLISNRQKLETQYQENKIVLDEFNQIQQDKENNKIEEYPKIFKKTGLVLLPVEFEESEGNVAKRIEFITREIKRTEDLIKDTNSKLDKKRDELMKLRQ